MVSIDFEKTFQYRVGDSRGGTYPILPVKLINNDKEVDCLARLDSGASDCVFDGDLAVELGLVLREGESKTLTGVRGNLHGYMHRVTIEIDGDSFHDCEVVFSDGRISRHLLGRNTFFDKIKVGFAELHGEIYFSPNPQR